MNVNPKYLSLAVLLLIVLGCKNLSGPQKLESEAATTNPNQTIVDAIVFLNGQGEGTTRNLSDLKRHLSDILKQREDSGLFIEGTNKSPDAIYLFASPELTLGALADLYKAIDEAKGNVCIPRKKATEGKLPPTRPNPLFLAVTIDLPVGLPRADADHPSNDDDHQYSYNITMVFVRSDQGSLKSDRAWHTSIEISTDERFFINDKQGSEADKGEKHTQIKQRPVDASTIGGELSKILETEGKEILVIASDKASYGALTKVLEALSDQKAKFRVLVRRP